MLCWANGETLGTGASEPQHIRDLAAYVDTALRSAFRSGIQRLRVGTGVKSIHGRPVVEL